MGHFNVDLMGIERRIVLRITYFCNKLHLTKLVEKHFIFGLFKICSAKSVQLRLAIEVNLYV
jgi:hypothetical protein